LRFVQCKLTAVNYCAALGTYLNRICLRITQFGVVFAQYLRRKELSLRKASILQCSKMDHRLKVAIQVF
jgi:hypothetical protein